jgi:hypothetical protein
VETIRKPFRDEVPFVKVSSLRRSGEITAPASLSVKVRFGDFEREVRVRHSLLNAGNYRTYFLCPTCANQAMKLRLYDGRIVCCRCDGLKYRCQFGHDSSKVIERLQELLYGPNPAKKNRKRLELLLRRATIVERVARLKRAAQ